MKAFAFISAALAAALLLNSPVDAHHSRPVFWQEGEKIIRITGIMKKIAVINPHSTFIIEVTEPNGQKVDWTGVTGSGASLARAGWTRDGVGNLKIGTKVIVEGNPPRDESVKGILVNSFTLPDGTKITVKDD